MSEKTYTKVLISDLMLQMSIGIHAHEKAQKQRVIVNVELFTDDAVPVSIKEAVCYESVSKDIKSLAASKHYDLVEVLAEDIAGLCLDNDKVKRVVVRIEKPDIMPDGTRVGVEISRS